MKALPQSVYYTKTVCVCVFVSLIAQLHLLQFCVCVCVFVSVSLCNYSHSFPHTIAGGFAKLTFKLL